ncbi:unnamed protein product [Meganyctiphanes norvegica]|uniref:BZIP domain-containing protein n=1 Tax=Meganyctiphanes norvegica TaxID=48144 RepID=A0AAV2S1W5_MEGNR
MDELMTDEDLRQMHAEMQDPNADIDLFSEYVQHLDDLITTMDAEQKRLVEDTEIQEEKEALCESTIESQLPIQGKSSQDDAQDQSSDTVIMILNTECPTKEALVGANIVTPKPLLGQEFTSCCSTTNRNDIDIAAEESRPCSSNASASHTNDILNEFSSANQVTGQDSIEIKTSKLGPLRTGRNRQNETPLHLMPEPDNAQEPDLKRLRAAKTSKKYRESQKTKLVEKDKKINELVGEIVEKDKKINEVVGENDELRNELKCVTLERDLVTVERDNYKNILESSK